MRYKAFNSIQTKIILMIIIMSSFVIAITFLTVKSSEAIVSKKVIDLTSQNLEQININFQQVIDGMLIISNILEMDKDFFKTLKGIENQEKNIYELKQKIIDKIASYMAVILRYNCHITFIDNNYSIYTSWNKHSEYDNSKNFFDTHWYKDTVSSNGKIIWIVPHESYIPGEKSTKDMFISMSRLIKGDKSIGGYGVILVSIYINELENKFNESLNSGTEGFSIIDEKGTMVLKTDYFYNNKIDNLKWCINDINFNQAKGNFTSVYQGTKMQVIYKKLTYTGLTSVYMIPYDAMQKEIKKLNTRNTVLIIIFIIVFILIAAFLSFTIIYPIKYLSSQMRKVTYQNLDMEVKVRAGDEIGQLTESFNTMLRNIRKLVNEIRINEHEKKELHLEVLQNQINPHFLLNTLNAIKWNAYVNGIQNVGDMIATLGGLLETIIDRKSECVLIREEISYIKNYITLMSFRYNQDISVTYDIEQQVLDYYTLKFILQPIVENSIIHGFEDNISERRLNISIKTDNQKVIYKISDNGKGIPCKDLCNLLKENRNTNKRRFTGVGISNVNDRIKLHFGSGYGLMIKSKESFGTTVYITIPVLKDSVEIESRKSGPDFV